MSVFELACSGTSSSSPASNAAATRSTGRDASRAPQRDFVTTISLMLASRSFFALVAPLLYSHVWISRPSSLACFHHALISHPALGSLVKSIHVGPDADVAEKDYPLIDEEGYPSEGDIAMNGAYIKCSLQGEEKSKLLPRWAGDVWRLAYSNSTPAGKAIFSALQSIQQTIDVDLGCYKHSHGGRPIAHAEYTIRVWEAQAALDCYLMAMRGYDDSCSRDPSLSKLRLPSYPTLVLTGYPTATSVNRADEGTEVPYVVSRSQLIQHLCRRDSPTDRFNHPLLFARSGIDSIKNDDHRCDPELPHDEDGFGQRGWPNLFALTGRNSSSNCLLPNTATLGSIINLLRSTLPLLINLETLSLTGFLELGLSGCSLPTVRSLAIGPGSVRVDGPLRCEGLAGVEELRLCGMKLDEAKLDEICAKMPSLRRLEVSDGQRRCYPYLQM